MALIKTGDQTARLVTINYGDKSYNIIPGGKDREFTEVPDDVLDLPFVNSLLESGALIARKGTLSNQDGESLEDLQARAEALGIKVDKRWKIGRLKMEIESAESE